MLKKIRMIDGLLRKDMPLKPTSAFEISQQNDRVRNCSYFGPSLRMKGDISLDESLRIEGEVEGTLKITGKTLTVGKKATVTGEVHANVAEVHGNVEGDMHSKELVHMHATAAVNGTIHCSRIVIEDGAQFNGQVEMRKKPVERSDEESESKNVTADVVSIGK